VSEAGLRGHLQGEGDEEKGSQAYVPADPKDDRALQEALALLRGTETNPAFPPNPKQAGVAQ
jgi:carboxyl-terminal processing protease